MQITEALISEPGDIRRFIQQAVDHWPHLLAFHFTLHSTEGNIDESRIHAFCTSFYRQVYERITERNHTASPSSPLVLRWLRGQHGGATIRCLLLLSQTSICHPRASVTGDEECSQVVDLLQQAWRVISAGGQCRVERCFRVARPDTSEQYVALKTAALSFGLPAVSGITNRLTAVLLFCCIRDHCFDFVALRGRLRLSFSIIRRVSASFCFCGVMLTT